MGASVRVFPRGRQRNPGLSGVPPAPATKRAFCGYVMARGVKSHRNGNRRPANANRITIPDQNGRKLSVKTVPFYQCCPETQSNSGQPLKKYKTSLLELQDKLIPPFKVLGIPTEPIPHSFRNTSAIYHLSFIIYNSPRQFLHSAFSPSLQFLHSAFCILHSAFCLLPSPLPVWNPAKS